ncbi:hypothetical protein EVAR_94787_1 [Eumeta japonica]|uniref:Uncharacterized protein n=1 Tax=Eumeta variegata TaxID=151549 RepID=A0A4C1UHI0_EUMVA|nr:hypothetical protein EVAR_94787_1 [Eumeta japonica]
MFSSGDQRTTRRSVGCPAARWTDDLGKFASHPLQVTQIVSRGNIRRRKLVALVSKAESRLRPVGNRNHEQELDRDPEVRSIDIKERYFYENGHAKRDGHVERAAGVVHSCARDTEKRHAGTQAPKLATPYSDAQITTIDYYHYRGVLTKYFVTRSRLTT